MLKPKMCCIFCGLCDLNENFNEVFKKRIKDCVINRNIRFFYVSSMMDVIFKMLDELRSEYNFCYIKNSRQEDLYIPYIDLEKFLEFKFFKDVEYSRSNLWVVDYSTLAIFITSSDYSKEGDLLHYARRQNKEYINLYSTNTSI